LRHKKGKKRKREGKNRQIIFTLSTLLAGGGVEFARRRGGRKGVFDRKKKDGGLFAALVE